MAKIVIMEAILIDDAEHTSDGELEDTLLKYFQEYPPKFPWFKEVRKITVKSI